MSTDTATIAVETLGERFTRIKGRAVPYDQPENIAGLFDERIAYGAFTESLVVAGGNLPLLWSHQSDTLPIGRSIDWEERRDGLYTVWQIDEAPFAQEVARSCRDEYITGLSIGFVPELSTWEYAADFDPDRGQLDTVTVTKGRLYEVSVTPTPAYQSAQILAVEAEPVNDQARSVIRAARFELQARQRLRDLDHQASQTAANRAELDRWRRWISTNQRH